MERIELLRTQDEEAAYRIFADLETHFGSVHEFQLKYLTERNWSTIRDPNADLKTMVITYNPAWIQSMFCQSSFELAIQQYLVAAELK